MTMLMVILLDCRKAIRTMKAKGRTSSNNGLNGSASLRPNFPRPRLSRFLRYVGKGYKSKNRASLRAGKVHLAPMR